MKLIYCPECAAPLTKLDDTNYRCANGHPYFNNPHAACSVVLINDKHEVLFSKRGIEPQKGKYDFPGGFLNYDEDGYQATQREIREELQVNIATEDLVLIDCALHYYLENDTVCDFIFVCKKWTGEIQPSDDSAALEWKPLEFINSSEFAWPFPYLYDKVKRMIQ